MTESTAFEGFAIVEEWRPVVGFEGLYEVSSLGDVRRIGPAAKTGHGRGGGAVIGRHVRKHMIPGGYWHVQLWRKGGPKTLLVHRVVAAVFIGPLPDGKEVNHLDGDKANNAATNLEYVTRSENMQHAYRTGLRKVTIGEAVKARRKHRRKIPCSCGCGTLIETPAPGGRDRHFVSGHNMRSVA